MGVFEDLHKLALDNAQDNLVLRQSAKNAELLQDSTAESLADLHAKVDALKVVEIEQPDPVIDEVEPEPKPQEPETPVVVIVDDGPLVGALKLALAPIKSISAKTDNGSVSNLNKAPDTYPHGWYAEGDDIEMDIELFESLSLDLVSLLLHNPSGSERVYSVSIGGEKFELVASLATDARETSRYNVRLPSFKDDGFTIRFQGNDMEGNDWNGGYRVEVYTSSAITKQPEAKPVDVVLPADSKGRPLLVFPDKPETGQQDALPLKIHDNGTAELSRASQVELSHEPSKQGAPIVDNVPDLVRELKKRPALIRVKGEAMKAMSVSLSSEGFDGGADGVTVIEPEHDGAICPNFYLQDSSAVVLRNFHNQNRTWKFRASGKCNSSGVSGIRFSEKTTKSPVGFSPPDQNRGSMDDCFAQDIFAVYDESVGFDEVMVVIGTGEIGWENYRVAHAKNLRIYNVSGLNRGEPIQAIANFSRNDRRVKARTNLEGCVFAGGLGVATYSVGKDGGNEGPENGYYDGKCHSDEPDDPNIVIGGMGIGVGASGSDSGTGTVEHGAMGYTKSSNHLFIAMPVGAASSAYHDMGGVEISHVHVCGGGDYPEWLDLGFNDYVNDKAEFAFSNYVDVAGRKKANMHSNTAFAHSAIGDGGGKMLNTSQVRELMFKLPAEFGAADSRMAKQFSIWVPKKTKELIW